MSNCISYNENDLFKDLKYSITKHAAMSKPGIVDSCCYYVEIY